MKKKAKRQKRKSLWANRFNLVGLYSLEPVEVFWDRELREYYDKEGNFSTPGTSSMDDPGCMTFVSPSWALVEAWTLGALAVGKALRDKFPGP